MEIPVEKLKPFIAHGIQFSGMSGNQAFGKCPFSGKEDKFYVNVDKLLWDSKTSGLSGNFQQFMEEIQKIYVSAMTKPLLKTLAENRGLPEEALLPWEIGWTGKSYAIPIRNPKGRIQDIRFYRLGEHPISTPGCKTGLLGAHLLYRKTDEPIYICEGEWDAIAMSWLLSKTKQKGAVLGVPGANTLKDEWVPLLSGKKVYTFYDNDSAGESGERVFEKKVNGTAKEVFYVHWPSSVKDKFDVRDWITYGAVQRKTPKKCHSALLALLQPYPRTSTEVKTAVVTSSGEVVTSELESKYETPPELEEVFSVFKKWLFLANTQAVEMMLAVMLSNRIEGDPIWMFLISPPGGAKTETLNSLSRCPEVFMTSSLTPHSLISGASWANGSDPSLIPKLNGKVLVIKDFTSILAKRDTEKDEIFGILRDAYDGHCGKVFGTGITRAYKSRFSILAASTPRIYELANQHQGLGERFMKFLVGDNLRHVSEVEIILKSIDNINQETQMRLEMSDVVGAFLKKAIPAELPKIPSEFIQKIVALAQFGARLRGTVSREVYRPEIIVSKPSAEVGSRVGKQLAKLAISLALVHGRKEVGEYEYKVVKKTMLDTIPQRSEDIVRSLYLKAPTLDDTLKTKDISFLSRYPQATVSRVLADMNILDIVVRRGETNKIQWTLSEYIREAIKKAELYTTGEEIQRARNPMLIRVSRKPKEKDNG